MSSLLLISCSLVYLALLFLIADRAERRGLGAGRSVVNNPYVYSLSLAVYCTAWTFYGSVGKAASEGIEFMAAYVGPTLTAPLWWLLLRKIIRICKKQNITSIADFISARYGKSRTLGVLVTLFCVAGSIPYISIQIKAIAVSLLTLSGQRADTHPLRFWDDQAFLITLVLALFAILFGTRKLEATERHEGLVATVAFESLVKLLAFVSVGIFVTFGLFDGPGAIFRKAATVPALNAEFSFGPGHSSGDWFWQCLVSGFAVLFLPRQFQVAVVENVNEKHLRKAMWLFPLYMFLISLFVLPMAFGGQLLLGNAANPDEYVLSLPMLHGQTGLALFAYLGGFSAATSMIILETTALSVMISNNLVMPLLLTAPRWQMQRRVRPGVFVLNIRRLAIAGLLLLAYSYYREVSNRLSLVSVGMISFTAVSQFAPAIIGGLFWKQGTKTGARWGLIAGSSIWFYTLIVPTLVPTFLPASLLTEGPFGISLLNPLHLLGLRQDDPVSHAAFWSLFVNTSLYIWGSLRRPQTAIDANQAVLFVDIFKLDRTSQHPLIEKSSALLIDIEGLLATFFGPPQANQAVGRYIRRHKIDSTQPYADPRLVSHAERLLAGAVGAASARILMATVAKEEPITANEIIQILKSSQALMAANKELTRQSTELKQLTQQLSETNDRLKTADQQKDDFLSSVSHEIRTPITSIRALVEILQDEPDLDTDTQKQFLGTITRESERLTRLINQILELERIESGRDSFTLEPVSIDRIVQDSVETVRPLGRDKNLSVITQIPDTPLQVMANYDRLMQVLINLVSNAIKFSPAGSAPIWVTVSDDGHQCRVQVIDQGIGISPADQELIFDKFYRGKAHAFGKSVGSGLGLTISRTLIQLHNGTLTVDSTPGHGSTFTITLPLIQEN